MLIAKTTIRHGQIVDGRNVEHTFNAGDRMDGAPEEVLQPLLRCGAVGEADDAPAAAKTVTLAEALGGVPAADGGGKPAGDASADAGGGKPAGDPGAGGN
jgi:hypothetical protein